MIIEPILSRVGFPLVADVPGVGEHLGNDGAVMVKLNRSTSAAVDPNKDNLYAGGAFTPYPNAAANPDNPFQASETAGRAGRQGREEGVVSDSEASKAKRSEQGGGLRPISLPCTTTTTRHHMHPQTTLRFGQLIGADQLESTKDFSIGASGRAGFLFLGVGVGGVGGSEEDGLEREEG